MGALSNPSARLGLREKIGYGLGDVATNFFFQAFNIFLLYYYTDIFGLSATWVGSMILFVRLWDSVSDPMMGILADRTRTRWGRYRPYLLWGAAPYGLIGFLIFANPPLAPEYKPVYAIVTYVAMMTASTVISIPYSSLMGVMSRSSDERTTLSTFRFIGAFGGALLISAGIIPLKNLLGGVHPGMSEEARLVAEAMGFRYTMALFAVIAVACFWFTFASTRERIDPPNEKGFGIRRDVALLFRNRAWTVLCGVAILMLTGVAVRNGAVMYYFKYYVGRENQAVIFFTSGGIAVLLGVMVTKPLNRRWSKRRLLIVLSLLNALCIFLFYFIPREKIVWLHATNAVGLFFAGPTSAIVWAMYSDTADYAEWKFHRRATALTFSSVIFAQKLGLALGAAMTGWILGWLGFMANQEQSVQTVRGIRIIFSLVPAACTVGVAGMVFLYPLEDAFVRRIGGELMARNIEGGEGAG